MAAKHALESDLRDALRRYALNELSVTSILLKASGERGWMDVLFFVPGGRPLLMETKRAADGAPSPHQCLAIYRMEALHYDVALCYTYAEGVAALRAAVDAARRSKNRHAISLGTERCWSVVRPRNGQDK